MAAKVDFKYEDGSKIFFTSDSHFFHDNIIKFCNRPFNNVEEMNQIMVDNWNNKVPHDGLVFHLGDFAWGGYNKFKEVREKLNGEIILIKGNHDEKNGPNSREAELSIFKGVLRQAKLLIENRQIYVNHVPFLCYGGTYRDKNAIVYQLFGHVHISNHLKRNNGKDFERCVNNLFPTQYDVGVDFNEFAPISWHEVNVKIQAQIEKNDNLKMWINND